MSGMDPEALAAEVLAMTPTLQTERVTAACDRLIEGLRASARSLPTETARRVLGSLRRERYFTLMQRVADALIRFGCDAPVVHRQYAQALIDCGQLVPAVELLGGLVRRTREEPGEHAEALGLLGRAHKQIYVAAAGSRLGHGRKAMERALDAYRKGFEVNPAHHVWHGVNLVALLCRARRDGLRVAAAEDAQGLARQLVAAIEAKSEAAPAWDYGTAAEAAVALGDWDAAERWLKRYIAAPDVDAFALAGTLRQFTEVWGLEPGSSRQGQLVTVLHAALLQASGGGLELPPTQLQGLATADKDAFERILGDIGAQTYTWLKKGLQRADSVAMVRQEDGRGIGTGFLVRGGDIRPDLGDEPLLLTNAHVVSDDPVDQALPREAATVTFEARDAAADSRREHRVAEIVGHSPRAALDFSLLRLAPRPEGLPVCPVGKRLPAVGSGEKQRVYVIGHPEGRELSFSLQDNLLLDHEAPPRGTPSLEGRVLLHYRAPTEPGSSGSPVFEQGGWNVVGLHHAGGELMRRLNGQAGTYAANEGIWIQSIAAAVAAAVPGSR
jgi:S1-C subfamily serine protease